MSSKKNRVLIVDDEDDILYVLNEVFQNNGYEVIKSISGIDGLSEFFKCRPDLVITDLMMPGTSGLELVREIRKVDTKVPVFILTSMTGTETAVEGFNGGANDYIRKPFSIQELVARANAAIAFSREQKTGGKAGNISIGIFELNPTTRELFRDDGTFQVLRGREALILEMLARNLNNTVSSADILNNIWGDSGFYAMRSLQVHIVSLRKILGPDSDLTLINVRGYGYRLASRAASQ